ncbi:MAG TPA: serine hydrolase [Fulvivirga sp.]|nr:serine hydrolase [Fulvivirga sp.]
MKKIFKQAIVLVLFLGLMYGLSYAWRALPIISGYGAKNLCTCVFVAGRTTESVLNNELKTNALLSLGTFKLHLEDSSATGNVLGMVAKKAIYRRGLGCTLISGITEAEVRNQPVHLNPIQTPSDTLPWPYGTVDIEANFANVDYAALNKAVADAFIENNPERKINTRGVVVVYKDHVIAEKYAEGFDKDTPQIGWSMTKSITATEVGMLVKDGKLDVMQPAPLDLWKNDARKDITIDQLLRMSSGLKWDENYAGPSSATNMLFKSADMGAFAMKQPLAYTPDENWYYSSGTSNIISKIVRQTVGETEQQNFVRDRLFSPLGMTSAVIEPDASGTYVGSSYMYATPRDWAKFGLLYLHDGVWNGQRLLSEDWVKYVSTPTPKAPKGEYGAHFWLNAGEKGNPKNRYYPDAPQDIYSANGFEGQRVFIIPSKDMVIVRMGQTKGRGDFDFNAFLKNVLETVD